MFSSFPPAMTFWKLTSQIITFEHEGNWSKALEYYDLQVRSEGAVEEDDYSITQGHLLHEHFQPTAPQSSFQSDYGMRRRKPYKGLIRSLQQIGCAHVLDLYCQGLTSRKGQFQPDLEFTELQVSQVY